MTWKYVNPGDYRLLDVYSGGSNSADSSFDTGMYFTGTDADNSPVSVPDGVKELWLKFSAAANSNLFNFWLGTAPSNITGFYCNYDTMYIFVNGSPKKTIRVNRYLFNVYMHIKSSTASGKFEIYVDDALAYSFEGNVLNGIDLKCYSISTRSIGNDKMSGIIMQDFPLSRHEKVAVLPATVTSADGFTEYDGTYSTTEVNKTLWQSFDVSNISGVIKSFNIFPASLSSDTSVIDKIKLKAKQGGLSADIEITDANLGTYSPVLTNPITGGDWTKADFSTLEIGLETIKS